MNYIINSKNRKLKYKLHLLVDRLSFNFLNLTSSQKITFFWLFTAFFGLFINWFSYKNDINATISNTGFSINCWYVWYFIVLLLLFVAFIILSNTNKERLKSKVHVIFHDYTIIIFSWTILLILSFVIFNSIKWLSNFTQTITIWKWIVLEIIWWLFLFVWWVLEYREKKQEVLSRTYIENSKFEVERDLDEYKQILNWGQNNNDWNMKLPI